MFNLLIKSLTVIHKVTLLSLYFTLIVIAVHCAHVPLHVLTQYFHILHYSMVKLNSWQTYFFLTKQQHMKIRMNLKVCLSFCSKWIAFIINVYQSFF